MEQRMKVLVTGGCGYIGSHTCLALQAAGMEPVVVDNLCNSKASVLTRVAAISGREPRFYEGDIRDPALLDRIFGAAHRRRDPLRRPQGGRRVDPHPAGLLREQPGGTLVLLQAMKRAGVRNLVFSSSATVYGDPPAPRSGRISPQRHQPLRPIQADHRGDPRGSAAAEPHWSMTLLRYFNPVGAHESGTLGEDPQGIPNNLMPFLTQVAIGRRDCLSVFGNDYPTIDGTGVRDYIHVMDLAEGHVKALEHCAGRGGVHATTWARARARACCRWSRRSRPPAVGPFPYRIEPRRPGDIAECWADPAKAARELDWHASRDLAAMCADSWRWQSANPNGYEA